MSVEKKRSSTMHTRLPSKPINESLGARNFLKDGVTLENLEQGALAHSDNDVAQAMQKAKVELFTTFKTKLQLPTIYAQAVSGSFVD
jgi:hypothetical protein